MFVEKRKSFTNYAGWYSLQCLESELAVSKQESVNEEFVNLFITKQHFTKQSIVAKTSDWTETHKVFIKVTAKS